MNELSRTRIVRRLPRISEQQKRTAHHVAGHAVVAWAQGVTLREISIVPVGKTAGHADIAQDLEVMMHHIDERTALKAKLLITCAGMRAELRFNPKAAVRGGLVGIYQEVIDSWALVRRINETRNELPLCFLDDAIAETNALLEAYWSRVERLAEALLKHKTVSGTDATAIIGG